MATDVPPATAIDSSVLVASLVAAHAENDGAVAAIESTLSEEGGFVLASHSVLETYAVLTRLPPPHRLSPGDARRLLGETCGRYARLVPTVPPARLWRFLDDLAEMHVAGGRAYDALILRSVVSAGARRLLTLNARHFTGLAPDGFQVVGVGASG